jgi:hypothetical protein
MLIKDSSFCSALLQGMKCGLIMQNPKPKSSHVMETCPSAKEFRAVRSVREDHGSHFLGL